MKNQFIKILLLYVVLLLTGSAKAQDNNEGNLDDIIVYVNKEPDILDPGRGQRMPSPPIQCHISKSNGILITGFDSSEINTFTILDPYGNPILSFIDESSFIDYLFSLSGEYQIAFQFPDKTLSGWISI